MEAEVLLIGESGEKELETQDCCPSENSVSIQDNSNDLAMSQENCDSSSPQPIVQTGSLDSIISDRAESESNIPPSESMENCSTTELLHAHQFSPPTFSRLPPDGDEFPNNNCWPDEKAGGGNQKSSSAYRSEFSYNKLTTASEANSPPPPLPTSEPPRDDAFDFEASPPPALPPKRTHHRGLGQSSSFDSNNSGAIMVASTVKPEGSFKQNEEPSKKSVKDKIAMFSSRSSSSEDSSSPNENPPQPQAMFPKQHHIISSLSRNNNTPNTNGFSKSSENLLSSISLGGRKGSFDLSLPPPIPTKSMRGSTTSSGVPNKTGSSSLYERSQSMIDMNGGVGKSASYHNHVSTTTTTTDSSSRPISSMIEQRRKCITKLRGLVIPDEQMNGNSNNTTSSSVMDLPTIISKDATIITQPLSFKHTSKDRNNMSLGRAESLDRFSQTPRELLPPPRGNYINHHAPPPPSSAKTNSCNNNNHDLLLVETQNNALPKYSPAFKRRGLAAYHTSSQTLPSKLAPTTNSNATIVKSVDKKKEDSVSVETKEMSPKKLEDSDNDSAVSSSRSSISHGLSPPNSPTPGESSAATPDPDAEEDNKEQSHQSGQSDTLNLDESWRILKPTSIEAINRKNVLKSAKFSSGGGTTGNDTGADDSSLSSSTGKNRRSDDEEASYADAETEDTESSCSELEVVGNRRKSSSGSRGHNTGRNAESKVDTEDDDDEPVERSAVNMEFTELTESPLQAIYDMEVKMAYINEVCDALNDSRSRAELSSRYFSRRDSEATVIERPIEPKRKMSVDAVDSSTTTERRARNRSSSGNESDFSSNISQNSHKSLSRETSNGPSSTTTTTTDRWSLLEKKYSKSMTSVNNLGLNNKPTEPQNQQPQLTPATSVPKIIAEVVERKIEKIIEKTTSADSVPKNKTNPTIPRGRNDFKSISEKWQKIEKATDAPPSSSSSLSTPIKPIEKPSLATSSPQDSTPSTPRSGTSSSQFTSSLSSSASPSSATTPSSTSPSPTKSYSSSLDSSKSTTRALMSSSKESGGASKGKLSGMEGSSSWADKRRSEGEPPQSQRQVGGASGGTKRSVSVNDIRKAFEKAELSVNSFGREETLTDGKKDDNLMMGLSLPAAHFRVSSFDSTTSEEGSSAPTPGNLYGSSNSLVSSAPRDPYGSITSLASSTSLISPQELQQLIDEANQSLEEAGTPSHEVSVVILHREFAGGSLGITLAGGADYENKEIKVHKVLNSSIADRDGRVLRGDRILSINGKSTRGLTHREALNLLKSPRTEVVLVVSRGRSASNGFQTIEETSALDRAVEPLLMNGTLGLENDDDTGYKWGPLKTACLVKDGAGLGFSLEGGKGSIQGDKPLTVKKIFIGGPAEKSGDLKLGDLIVSINNINMSSKSRTEAWNFMKKLSDGEVRIAIRSPR